VVSGRPTWPVAAQSVRLTRFDGARQSRVQLGEARVSPDRRLTFCVVTSGLTTRDSEVAEDRFECQTRAPAVAISWGRVRSHLVKVSTTSPADPFARCTLFDQQPILFAVVPRFDAPRLHANQSQAPWVLSISRNFST
jgi:hypothetical protein